MKNLHPLRVKIKTYKNESKFKTMLLPLLFLSPFFEVKNKDSKDSLITESNIFHREKDTAKQNQEETLNRASYQ